MIGRLMLCALLAMPAGGCGWHSLYADRSDDPAAPALASVRVDPIGERVGQIVTIGLRDGFNPTGEAVPGRYRLTVAIKESRGDLALRPDETASRSQYTLNATFTLRDSTTGELLLTGTAVGQDAFDRLTNSYAIIVSDQAARRHAAQQVVQEIQLRVAGFLERNQLRQAGPSPR